jgi:hypothetical protein
VGHLSAGAVVGGAAFGGACGFDYWGKVVYTEGDIAKYHERDLAIMAEAEAVTRTWARPGEGIVIQGPFTAKASFGVQPNGMAGILFGPYLTAGDFRG